MEAMGLAAQPAVVDGLKPQSAVRRARVIVIGGGVAGLTSAYELGKVGYDCTILEARTRPGGRVLTLRRGVTETDIDGNTQTCRFDEGLYCNVGAMRIPQHHTMTFDYCRELGLPIEPFLNSNEGAFLYNTQGEGPLVGKRVRARAARADIQGYITELLEKALDRNALDAELDASDRERLVEFLRKDGALTNKGRYVSSPRRGYVVSPGAFDQSGQIDSPHALKDLMAINYGDQFGTDQPVPQQMFQVKGGTDGLPRALAAKLGSRLQLGVTVTAVRKQGAGVLVRWKNTRGVDSEMSAAFCVLAVPLTVLKDMPVDLSPEMREAVQSVPYVPAGKIALQFSRRFWEEDDHIFGGISRTDQEISQIVYPSSGFLQKKGVLIGYYLFGDAAREMSARPPLERERVALEQGSKLHPQYPSCFESSFSIAWDRTKHSLGGWAQYSNTQRRLYYKTLCEPDGPLYLAGDHLSYLSGWLAGALGSARGVAQKIHERATRNPAAAFPP